MKALKFRPSNENVQRIITIIVCIYRSYIKNKKKFCSRSVMLMHFDILKIFLKTYLLKETVRLLIIKTYYRTRPRIAPLEPVMSKSRKINPCKKDDHNILRNSYILTWMSNCNFFFYFFLQIDMVVKL